MSEIEAATFCRESPLRHAGTLALIACFKNHQVSVPHASEVNSTWGPFCWYCP
jgi:hypothetical protein